MRLRAFVILGLAILIALTAFPGQAQAATFTVTKTEDTFDAVCDDDCSLRDAIAAASPGDNIMIPPGTYTLTLGAQITIDKDLTLTGAGADLTIIEAATEPDVAAFRVFTIAGSSVGISGVTIRHGNISGNGGGIWNSGSLTLTDVTVSSNIAEFGGGFRNLGTLILTNSTVISNTAIVAGGGIENAFNSIVTLINTPSVITQLIGVVASATGIAR